MSNPSQNLPCCRDAEGNSIAYADIQRLAKPLYGVKPYRGFESLRLRQSLENQSFSGNSWRERGAADTRIDSHFAQTTQEHQHAQSQNLSQPILTVFPPPLPPCNSGGTGRESFTPEGSRPLFLSRIGVPSDGEQ